MEAVRMEMAAPLLEWLDANRQLLGGLGAVSVLTFFGSLLALPILVVRLPADYFSPARQASDADRPPRSLGKILWRVGRNLAGVVFVAAGAAMLLLPGQGILTMLIGLTLIDFPGKRRLERRLVSPPSVRRAIDWMRRRRGRPPLEGFGNDGGRPAGKRRPKP